VVCPCNGRTYNDLIKYQEHCLNDSENLDTEQTLECVPCARVFAARQDYFNHLKISPSHDGISKFAKAPLNLSRANDTNPGLGHPVVSRKPDFSVGQAIQELKEVKDNINNPLLLTTPAATCSTMGDRAFISSDDRSTWTLPDCFPGLYLSLHPANFHV
jgi:hypothetical protein